jgi:transcriptional regulator with XRE-family HTH domain
MKLEVGPLGERLAELRTRKGLSLSAVADAAGIAKSYLAKLERGEVPNPGLKTLDSIAKALDVTLAHLLAPEARASTSTVEHDAGRERLLAGLPRSLREFIHRVEAEEGELPAIDISALAILQFRGKKPESLDDWQFLYEALKRSIR